MSYKTEFQSNNTDLQHILDIINNLPNNTSQNITTKELTSFTYEGEYVHIPVEGLTKSNKLVNIYIKFLFQQGTVYRYWLLGGIKGEPQLSGLGEVYQEVGSYYYTTAPNFGGLAVYINDGEIYFWSPISPSSLIIGEDSLISFV